jgi:hypothetical protein
MEKLKQNTSFIPQYLAIASAVLVSCFLLFSIDKDTKQLSDLFKLGNLAALVLYFIPAFLMCLILFRSFVKRQGKGQSILKSLVIGIPIAFTLIISLLYWVLKK